MKKFIETPNLLKSIKADDLESIYNHIIDKAAEWAIGGYLGYANKLLEDLWAFHSGDPADVRMELEGLQIVWEISGNLPSSIPFACRNTEDIEKENWAYTTMGIADRFKGKDITGILNRFESDLQQFSDCRFAAAAALFAVDNGLIPEAEKFIRYWGHEYMKGANCTVGQLTRNRGIATILLQGILSPVFEMSEEKCNADYFALSSALRARKEKGRSLIYGDQSWTSLLKKISILSIEQNPDLYPDDIVLSKWFGTSPATEKDILAAEKKIGMSLPVDYREFLKASNGFLEHTYSAPRLARVEEIDWLSKFDDDVLDIVAGFVEETIEEEKDKYSRISKKCLLVSGMYQETEVLLFPTHDNDWECWSLTLGGGCGETWFPSFRYYMENELYFLECELPLD